MPTISDHDDAIDNGPHVSRGEAQEEDGYWQRRFWQERYYRWDLDYEDYAPAYCVGYVGRVQYGDDFEQAEVSLCANWQRIKGDSRLSLEEAMQAIRAAWQRMGRDRDASPVVEEASPGRPRVRPREERPLATPA